MSREIVDRIKKNDFIENNHIAELEKYLNYEGIYGYLDSIIDILCFGKKSIYYSKEIEEEE